MRYIAIVAVVAIVLAFSLPLIMMLGRKVAAWARVVWKDADKAELTLVPKKSRPDEDPPKQEK